MRASRTVAVPIFALGLVLGAGIGLWTLHAQAWDLGGRSPVLGYDAAQYAVAARELATHGRLATPFALPVELATHTRPPWPLALVQPGLVLVESVLFRVASGWPPGTSQWLVLLLPLFCYIACGLVLTRATGAVLASRAPEVTTFERTAAAVTVGLAFLLDPEAQHYAAGGFTEMPFTLAILAALVWIARGGPRRPLLFGLLLGAGGLFRGSMLWLAAPLALCFALSQHERRGTAFTRALLGYALVLSPWWIYKWLSFGTPAWDLSAVSVWDGVGGRTWFSLNHLPSAPDVPHGTDAVRAIAAKLALHVPDLSLRLAVGPRTLWIGGLVLALFAIRGKAGAANERSTSDEGAHSDLDADIEPIRPVASAVVESAYSLPDEYPTRSLRAAALAAIALVALGVIAAAASVPLARYLAPARLAAEAAGLIAVWALLWHMPRDWAGPTARRVLCATLAVLAIGWGFLQTTRGMSEAHTVAGERGIPDQPAMERLARWIDGELEPGETVMSNLGPSLAWFSRRPVIHLALTPADLDACRRRSEFDRVLVVFRSSERAWPGWSDLIERPLEAPHNHEWNIAGMRAIEAPEGFTALWLELGTLGSPMANGVSPRAHTGASPGALSRSGD